MNIWRMAFRHGNQGVSLWPECYDNGVAAITYFTDGRINLGETDLSQYPEYEKLKKIAKEKLTRNLKELRISWKSLAPSQKHSLNALAYEMKGGDIIYVKKGTKINGKGYVKGKKGQRAYTFDFRNKIKDPHGNYWKHQIPVKWVNNFPEISILVGKTQQFTIEKLSIKDMNSIERKKNISEEEEVNAKEGEIYNREVKFRKRNRTLINMLKYNSDYTCKICGFSFEKSFGIIGKEFIVAHHIEPISKRTKPKKTKAKDIVLVCANCHSMLHTEYPPLLPKKLKKLLKN